MVLNLIYKEYDNHYAVYTLDILIPNYYNPTQGLNKHTTQYVLGLQHTVVPVFFLCHSYIVCILFTVEHVLSLRPTTRIKFLVLANVADSDIFFSDI